MKALLLTSTGKRHAYLANRLKDHFNSLKIIREEKGLQSFYANHPDREIIKDHFQRLATTEEKFFSECQWQDLADATQTVPRGRLNQAEIAESVRKYNPDMVAVFGCGIIKPPLLNVIPEKRTFNLHQGLSPYYRGSGTNFWPFVEGKPEYIGVTLHFLDPNIDSGGIIAHDRPEIEPGNTLHTIGCKTVVKSADLLLAARKAVSNNTPLFSVPQWSEGKLYKRADLNGKSIEKLRKMESSGFIDRFVEKRNQGTVAPVQLIKMEN